MIIIARKTITTIFAIVAILGITISTLFLILNLTGNFNVSSIKSNAMSPTIKNGSWIVSTKVDSGSIQEGDVVVIPLANSSETTVLGRVDSKIESKKNTFYYQLKGDHDVLPNQWTYKANASTYKFVLTVPAIGYLSNPVGISIIGSLIVVLAIIYLFFLHKPKEKIIQKENNTVTPVEWTAVDEIKSLFGENKN